MQPSRDRASFLDMLARGVVIVGLGFMPVFVIPAPWAAIAQSKMLLLAGVLIFAAALWMAARVYGSTIHLPRNPLFFAVLLLPGAYGASAIVTGFSDSALVGSGIEQDALAVTILWFATFALAALLFNGRTPDVYSAVRALALGLLALFVFQIKYLLFPAWLNLGFLQGQTANLLGSWHDLGILAGFALAGVMMLWRSGAFAGRWRIVAVTLGITASVILFLVHFADVLWGAAVLLMVASLVVLWSDVRTGFALKDACTRSLVPFVCAVVLGLAATAGASWWDKLPERIRIFETEVRPSWQGTFEVGKQSLDAPSRLLFGSGPNSFVREWGMYKPDGVNTTAFWNADFASGVGTIPTSVFTAGVIGLVAWGAIVLALMGLAWRFIRHPRPLHVFLVLGSLYLLAFHMFYTPGIAISALTFLCMGLLVAIAAGDTTRVMEPRSLSGSVLFALTVLCAVPVIASAGLVGREIVSNLLVNRAVVVYQSSGDTAKAARSLARAIIFSPRNDRAHRAAAELGLVEFAVLLASGVPQTDETRSALQNTLQATIRHGLTAVEINSGNYHNWLSLAQVYSSLAGANVDGAYEEARATYERAAETNPTNPLPKLRLAQLSAAHGDYAGARSHLDEALALKQDFAAAHFLRSQIDAVTGDTSAATEAAAAAVQLVPDDPLGWFNLGRILYASEDFADAAVVLEQAVARAGDYSNALFYLSASYYKLGRIEDAVGALRRVVELNPELLWVQQALGMLLQGGDPFTGDEERLE